MKKGVNIVYNRETGKIKIEGKLRYLSKSSEKLEYKINNIIKRKKKIGPFHVEDYIKFATREIDKLNAFYDVQSMIFAINFIKRIILAFVLTLILPMVPGISWKSYSLPYNIFIVCLLTVLLVIAYLLYEGYINNDIIDKVSEENTFLFKKENYDIPDNKNRMLIFTEDYLNKKYVDDYCYLSDILIFFFVFSFLSLAGSNTLFMIIFNVFVKCGTYLLNVLKYIFDGIFNLGSICFEKIILFFSQNTVALLITMSALFIGGLIIMLLFNRVYMSLKKIDKE